jgi:uncharacterized protein (TIGR03435 family)
LICVYLRPYQIFLHASRQTIVKNVAMRKLAAIVLLPFAASGQAFESATVRLSAPSSTGSRMVDDPTRFEFLYSTVKSLLALAYHVNTANVRGPDWIGTEAIDVIAQKPPHTTEEGERSMLQALLADRFKLVVHRDSYDLTAYDLMAAKGGPKVKMADRNLPVAIPQMSPLKGPARRLNGTLSMEQLATALQLPMESPVTDATGLRGSFDISLQWSPEDAIAAELPGATFPPLAKALEQQLGLKLEPRKVKIETLVVDSGLRIPAEH